jgi:preprotein translocase SecF subunit
MFRGIRLVPPNTKIPFMAMHKVNFAISGCIIVGTILLLIFKGLNLGIDFKGGILLEVRMPQAADLQALRSTLGGLDLGEVGLQTFGSENEVLIRLEKQEGGEEAQQAAVTKIKDALGPSVDYERVEVVGPQVSAELFRDGLIAIAAALAAIMIYVWFRFEWQFGVAAIVADLHDVVATIGLFALLGMDFDLTTVAALLTIAGYSVNDTVVVFDRHRENLRKYKAMPLDQLFDMSINQTLSRTTLTAATALIALVALYLFGGEVLRGFSTAMIWGILVGTYSSIFIATPPLLYMNVRRTTGAPERALVETP